MGYVVSFILGLFSIIAGIVYWYVYEQVRSTIESAEVEKIKELGETASSTLASSSFWDSLSIKLIVLGVVIAVGLKPFVGLLNKISKIFSSLI